MVKKNYFFANPGKYKAGERAEAVIYSSTKSSVLDSVHLFIKEKRTVSEEYLKKNSIRTEKGKFEKQERPVLASINWEPGIQRTDLDGNYYLVDIEHILPAGDRTFEETRGLLISDYQTYLENEWLRILQQKYAVKG